DIHQHDVGSVQFRKSQPVFTRDRFDHLVAGVREEIAQDASVLRVVLDHEYLRVHTVSDGRSTRTGSVNQKVEPSPGTASTHMRPPCISTIFFAIASPSPVPPFFRVGEPSTCWNSPKIRC